MFDLVNSADPGEILHCKPITGFIQASLSKIQGLLRTSKDYPTVFKD